MPVMKPIKALALRERKNEPCPQSWKMIKMRTRNPTGRTASGTASHKDTLLAKYMRYQRPTYGIIALVNCHKPGPRAGFWYLATISLQAGRFLACSVEACWLLIKK